MKASDLSLGPKRLKVAPKTRRKPDELIQTLVRLPWGVFERIDALAELFSVKRAQMIRAIVEAGVADLEKDRQAKHQEMAPALAKARKRRMGAGRDK